MRTAVIENLRVAEAKALQLFNEIEAKGILKPGKFESAINQEIFDLAYALFGIEKYWHKRIVRAGKNTLAPYDENPPNLKLEENDIIFFDFGPIFDAWEADFGRTYVIGNDPMKIKLKNDIELAWHETKRWYDQQTLVTCAGLYHYVQEAAARYGWEFGGEIAGHLIGAFPHEKLEPKNYGLYVHPENHLDMRKTDKAGNQREWILEIHFVDRGKEIGGFFEQLLT